MAINLACPSCRNPLVLKEEYLGREVQCPGCQHVFRVSSSARGARTEGTRSQRDEGYYDRGRSGPVLTAPRKRRDELQEDPEPRRRSRRTASHSTLWWMVGGAGAGLSLILLVVIGLLLTRPRRPAPPPIGDQHQEAVAAVPALPVPARGVPVAPAAVQPGVQQVAAVSPVAPGNLTGEQIYQQLLKSTVFIEARNAVPGGGGGPAAPGFPRPPLRPPFSKRIAPMQQGGGLVQSVWEGTEDLPGYGRLRFEFFSPVQVTMIDAKETSVGRWSLNGASIRLDFGGAEYNGTLNNNTLTGTARNPDGSTWRWSVNRRLGAAATQAPPRTSVRSGTGALIDPVQRLVITNVHVVGNATEVDVHFPRLDARGDVITDLNSYKTPLQGRVVMREPRADLALIQLNGVPAGAQSVRLASKKAMAGQDVHSIGNPGASKALWIYSPGKVRAVYKDQWKIQDRETNRVEQYDAMKLETSSPINPGDSGGPLVNDRGALVGVAHGQNLAANNLSYFIEVSEVRDLMRRYYQQIGQAWQPQTD